MANDKIKYNKSISINYLSYNINRSEMSRTNRRNILKNQMSGDIGNGLKIIAGPCSVENHGQVTD